MASGPSGGRARPPSAWSGSGTPSEESRAFFQERLSFFAKIAFVLSSGFLLFAVLIGARPPSALPWLSSGQGICHLGANAVLLGTWLWCARGVHPFAQLRLLEAAAVFLYCAAMSVSIAVSGSNEPGGMYATERISVDGISTDRPIATLVNASTIAYIPPGSFDPETAIETDMAAQ